MAEPGSGGYRPIGMRHVLGTLVLLLAVTACGDEDAPGTPADGCDDNASCEYPAVVVSGTAAGGEVSTEPTVLEDQDDVAAYVEQFGDEFAVEVTEAVAEVQLPPQHAVGAAVVSIGCDVPPSVNVET